MILYLSCMLLALHMAPYKSVLGKREILPRFIIETGVKPPIFGSYNYDPIKQVFEALPTQSPSVPKDAESVYPTGDEAGTAGLRNRVSVWYTKSNAWSARPVSAVGISKPMVFNATTTRHEATPSTQWWARAKIPTDKHTTVKGNLITI